MKKINPKNCKEDNFKMSFKPINNLIVRKEIREKFNIEQVEKSGRYHYYTNEENYIKFKDYVEELKKSHKKNKRRLSNGKGINKGMHFYL